MVFRRSAQHLSARLAMPVVAHECLSPVLVELALDLIPKMLCPYCVQAAQSPWGFNVTDHTNHNKRGGFDDGDCLHSIQCKLIARSACASLPSQHHNVFTQACEGGKTAVLDAEIQLFESLTAEYVFACSLKASLVLQGS